MAGHNKWSKIRRQKAVTDSNRSKAWATIARDIVTAARAGGPDPSANAKLALTIQKAKRENMPKDNIARAIRRATGAAEGKSYEEHTYEGYAPGGIGILVEALTDNTNRTVAALRSLFNKAGGRLGKAGSVAYLFERRGLMQVDASEEAAVLDLAIEAGAEDVEEAEGEFLVVTSSETLGTVHQAFASAHLAITDSRLVQVPVTTIEVSAPVAARVQRLIEQLEQHQDVRAVYSNMALP